MGRILGFLGFLFIAVLSALWLSAYVEARVSSPSSPLLWRLSTTLGPAIVYVALVLVVMYRQLFRPQLSQA